MKISSNSSRRRAAGMSLIECLVYIAVFAIMMNIAGVAFYFSWDHTQAVVYATDEIESALRAGECWRADVRAATGKISIETTATNEVISIPVGTGKIFYRFESGELRRETVAQNTSRLLLAKVKASQMRVDERGSVHAWDWELELQTRRKETHLPLCFTFEAVAKSTP
ncbi:MAG TPA: prepilin-type N-terminal cleavage/methylation domain-containing protein [Verrucomicrobiae bacterium]|jgi:Tfp pilus assembly protein FimT